ncbi:hypothetical protein BDW74DRAFT_161546 [Aspergillus multicolor]|uniref:uncharacterized protein n=1 Tax=Aspergillus multicolor TaxID=41759 RepID=UPI003CCCFE42
MPWAPHRVVDWESGQVYTETVSTPAISALDGPTWVHESPYLPSGFEEGSPFEASPLRHIAMRKLLLDQRNLSPVLFTNVPWNIAKDIWEFLGRCKKQTLHMWKLLATLYPSQLAETEQCRSMKIENPKLSMKDYLSLMKSDSLSWRVVLTLASSYARTPELVDISEIKNLCALDIATPAKLGALPEDTGLQITALTDRIVRTWSELAQAVKAFSHLRVLILRHQTELSKVALNYLRFFPSLQSVVAFGCPGIESALSGGNVDGWTITKVKRSAPTTLHTHYKDICEAGGSASMPAESPILDFQIGEMKKSRGPFSALYSAIYLQRIGGVPKVDPEPSTKKRKEAELPGGQYGQPRKSKAIMKDRTKDIGGVLSSFF